MRQDEIDQIEQWVSEGNIGAIEAKLTTKGANDRIEWRTGLLNGKDRIMQQSSIGKILLLPSAPSALLSRP